MNNKRKKKRLQALNGEAKRAAERIRLRKLAEIQRQIEIDIAAAENARRWAVKEAWDARREERRVRALNRPKTSMGDW